MEEQYNEFSVDQFKARTLDSFTDDIDELPEVSDHMELDDIVDVLPEEILEKFEMLEIGLDFKAESDLLSWFVDHMRPAVISYLESEDIISQFGDDEKVMMYAELDSIVEEARRQLFLLHKRNKEGTLVSEHTYLS